MGTACYKGYEPCTSAPWSRIRNISIDSQKSKLEMYASNESSAKRSFPSDSLLPIKVEVHWVHNLKVAGYQEAAQAIEGAENRGFGFRERDQPGPGPYDDMIRPRDGSTILFFTAADVFAMSKGNITTQSKLSRVLIDGGSTGFTEGSQIRNSFNAFAVYESHIGTTQNPERHRDLVTSATIPTIAHAQGPSSRSGSSLPAQSSAFSTDSGPTSLPTIHTSAADVEWIIPCRTKDEQVRSTRVIAPVVVDRPKPPIYTLLLGKRWIKNIGLIGYYERDKYTIRADDLRRIPVLN
ncbi:hypothetical protein EN45_055460 [Penicillium chrysogenum]|uniref:Uncharacterized protein n=1 Tax=Penicillium chrysogenum TaxID=5076 RepID=A0A161XWF6_PENCH|nr:hypothetical protein EN45_055460 [Penicillium chrysogenum]